MCYGLQIAILKFIFILLKFQQYIYIHCEYIVVALIIFKSLFYPKFLNLGLFSIFPMKKKFPAKRFLE